MYKVIYLPVAVIYCDVMQFCSFQSFYCNWTSDNFQKAASEAILDSTHYSQSVFTSSILYMQNLCILAH